MRTKRQVFVSHAGADTWVARQIARAVKGCGANPFLDEAEIQSGQDFESVILTFLNKAHELVVLLTPWALERPYVWAELRAAWNSQDSNRCVASWRLSNRAPEQAWSASVFKEQKLQSTQ
jgi:TIR domain